MGVTAWEGLTVFLSSYINRYEWRKNGVKLQNSLQIKVNETSGHKGQLCHDITEKLLKMALNSNHNPKASSFIRPDFRCTERVKYFSNT
jgi:hypothetical protein